MHFSAKDGKLSAMDAIAPQVVPFRIGFLMIDGFALLSYAAALEPLRAANRLAQRTVYDISHLPATGGVASSASGAWVPATTHIGERVDFDLMLVVAGDNAFDFASPTVFRWLRHLDRRGVLLAGISGAPVILARAGLMHQRRMTVHREHLQRLRARQPELIIEQTVYVRDRNRMTAAGGTASFDMMTAMIAEQLGGLFSRKVVNEFEHTELRPLQSGRRFSLARQYPTANTTILDAIESMENHLADPLDLAGLARRTALGTRQLNRLFSERLGQSTIAFYRKLRLDKAMILLQQTDLPVQEVALATGFAGAAHFSTRFREHFGIPPSIARRTHPEPA